LDLKTTKKLRKKIKQMGISYDRIATDDWDSFLSAFAQDNHDIEKKHTEGIEGNNCRLRHRVRRAFRRTCCFSKSCSTTGKPLIWLSFTAITALFEAHHTLWITSKE
jgi:IS1 family transposase